MPISNTYTYAWVPSVALKVDNQKLCDADLRVSSMLVSSVLLQPQEYNNRESIMASNPQATGKPVIRITLLGKAAGLNLIAKVCQSAPDYNFSRREAVFSMHLQCFDIGLRDACLNSWPSLYRGQIS